MATTSSARPGRYVDGEAYRVATLILVANSLPYERLDSWGKTSSSALES
jgi:hypothetical protein